MKQVNKRILALIAVLMLVPLALLHASESIVQADTNVAPAPALVALEKTLVVNGTHLIVPVANVKDGKPFTKDAPNFVVLGIYDGDKLVQSVSVALPQAGEASWLAAYPLDRYGLNGKPIKLLTVDGKKLVINGMDASFDGRVARIFTDRTFNEIYAKDGISYEIRKRRTNKFDSTETHFTANENLRIQSLKIFRLKSIWSKQDKNL